MSAAYLWGLATIPLAALLVVLVLGLYVLVLGGSSTTTSCLGCGFRAGPDAGDSRWTPWWVTELRFKAHYRHARHREWVRRRAELKGQA